MNSKDDKIIRNVLLYCVNNSKHKNNQNLKEFVLNEMTHNELLFLCWTGKILHEDRDNKLIKVPEWALTPFYVLAGGSLSGQMSKLFRKLSREKIPTKFGGHAAETLAGATIAFGATVLANTIYYFYKRSTDKCTVNCKSAVKKGKNYQSQFSVCFHKCKANSLNSMIKKLRSQKLMCPRSKYPEKCNQNINSEITKCQTQLEKELYRLKVSKETLFRRLRKLPNHMSSTPMTGKK